MYICCIVLDKHQLVLFFLCVRDYWLRICSQLFCIWCHFLFFSFVIVIVLILFMNEYVDKRLYMFKGIIISTIANFFFIKWFTWGHEKYYNKLSINWEKDLLIYIHIYSGGRKLICKNICGQENSKEKIPRRRVRTGEGLKRGNYGNWRFLR